MLIVLVKGLIIGLLIALPVGPAGALTIRRALVDGPQAGFLSGLGSAVADVVYLIFLQVGISTVSFSLHQTMLVRGVGGLMIIAVGLRLLLRKTAALYEITKPRDPVNTFLSAFLLSLINPTILLSLAALVTGFELGEASRSPKASIVLIVGVFSGSVLFWLLLSVGLQSVREVSFIKRVAGRVLVSLGIVIMLLAFVRS